MRRFMAFFGCVVVAVKLFEESANLVGFSQICTSIVAIFWIAIGAIILFEGTE